MAVLLVNTRQRDLGDFGNVGELKGVIANELRQRIFTDVVNTQSEVAGTRNGVRVSIVHLQISGTNFWEVVMAGGDAGDVTQGTINEVVSAIRSFHTL